MIFFQGPNIASSSQTIVLQILFAIWSQRHLDWRVADARVGMATGFMATEITPFSLHSESQQRNRTLKKSVLKCELTYVPESRFMYGFWVVGPRCWARVVLVHLVLFVFVKEGTNNTKWMGPVFLTWKRSNSRFCGIRHRGRQETGHSVISTSGPHWAAPRLHFVHRITVHRYSAVQCCWWHLHVLFLKSWDVPHGRFSPRVNGPFGYVFPESWSYIVCPL